MVDREGPPAAQPAPGSERETGSDPGRFDVIVLTGGAARRFGTDKLAARLGRGTVLEHTIAGCLGAGVIVLAGPRRPVADWACPPGARLAWQGEDPPGQGPVAGLAAAVGATTAGVLVVLGGDMPLAGRLLPAMLTALPADGATGSAGVVVADEGAPGSGRARPPLLWVLRRSTLQAQLSRVGTPAGAALHRVLDGLRLACVADPEGFSADIDTEADLAAARDRLTADATSPG